MLLHMPNNHSVMRGRRRSAGGWLSTHISISLLTVLRFLTCCWMLETAAQDPTAKASPAESASSSVSAYGRNTSGTSHSCRTVVVFAAGDVLLGRGAAFDLQRKRTPLQWLAPQSRAADISFCNLECALTSASNAAQWKPRLTAPPEAVHYLKDAGMDVVSVANNHALDAGEAGLEMTLTALHQVGIAGIGASRSDSPWQAWEKNVGGRRIAWLAASAYGPWRSGRMWVRNVAGTGLGDQVRSLSRGGAVVFVSLHWGTEFSRRPTAGQVQVAHGLIEAGAAAVFGHHPHVSQAVEVYRGRPIFYSLGNFVFDRLPGKAQDGFAGLVSVSPAGNVRFRVLPLSPTAQPPEVRPVSVPPRLPLPMRDMPLPLGETLVRMLPGHFLGEEGAHQVVVWSRSPQGGGVLRVFVRRPGGWRCLAEGHHPHIFDLQVGDIDGDGRDEVILGLVQRSKLDVCAGRRLYVYSVSISGVFDPRWRGSGLSRPFSRFWLLPTGGGCDLVALERNGLPEYRGFDWISIYRWNGFGLRCLWDTPVRGIVQNLQTGRDDRGSFVTFDQASVGVRRSLILRPHSVPGPDGNAEFAARLLRDDPDAPERGEKAKQFHASQPHEHVP